MNQPSALERTVAAYSRDFGAPSSLIVRAPGRVNLIGEHTDYNDGFVLPMALPFAVVIAGEPRTDGRVIAQSEGFEPTEFELSHEVQQGSWATYVHGTATMLTDEGFDVGGWQGCLASDIPPGASLSSSAALEVASGLAFVSAVGTAITPGDLARIGQRVENEVMGFPSGIMDQLASATGREGAASLIDCRSLESTPVRLPDDVAVVIMDTGTRRELVESEYAARRADCEAAAAAIGVHALRDATLNQLDLVGDPRLTRRAHHVITENARTLEAVAALRAGDADHVGVLMNASHTSLRDDFEVSGPALDAIVDLAQQTAGCFGARMTGGGFAGAAVAIVDRARTNDFVAAIKAKFAAPAAQPSTEPVRLYPVRPAAGASVVKAPLSPAT